MYNASLYIHIPFCQSKCLYCDFCSYVGSGYEVMSNYIDRVIDEAYSRRDEVAGRVINTIFIGGGTPSVLPDNLVLRLMENLSNIFDLSGLQEFTIEANPNSLTASKTIEYKLAGVTRISIGVQSFNDDLLRSIGRIHSHEQAVNATKIAINRDFRTSVDLMLGLPGQTMADVVSDIDTALSLGVEHISCYSLILEEGTPLYNQVSSGAVTLPDEDTVVDYYTYVSGRLREHGMDIYEVSNFGVPCQHNIAYWQLQDYLGLGVAAHSLTCGSRRHNTDSLEEYLAGSLPILDELMTEKSCIEEVVMLGLRMSSGIDISLLDRYANQDQLKQLVSIFSGFGDKFVVTDTAIALNNKYIYIMNSIICEVMEEIDKLWS